MMKIKTTRNAHDKKQTQNACHTSLRITSQNTQMHVARPRKLAKMRMVELLEGHGHSAQVLVREKGKKSKKVESHIPIMCLCRK